ncbi:MAG: DNA-binding domain-containing protein, partial [Planctomycetes bacterium]|nr:DNA-binding domain-containing protein [Planctomycetota bacterium]
QRAVDTGLDVYNSGYLQRLVEVLQADFGAVQHMLGEDEFRRVAARYVAAFPSRHPNLNRFGRHFSAFLHAQRRLPKRGMLAELATLEWALCVAFDAPEFSPLDVTTLQSTAAGRWPRARFVANPSLQLLCTRHPVDECYQQWKDTGSCVAPPRRRGWLCVFRRQDQVWRQRLTAASFAVLEALVAGQPLGRALGVAGADEPVAQWFRDFAADGLFVSCRFDR